MAPSRLVLRVLLLVPLLSFLPAALSAPRCNAHDKRILLHLKTSLGNPDVGVTWDAAADCCRDWSGVECDPDTGQVTYIQFSFSNGAGPLPAFIGHLPYLRVLSVRKNGITGTIPSEISKLSNLKELWLDMNHLTGPVPDFLGRMPKLEYIDLADNKLSGTIPPSLGDLPQLQGLFLGGNRLTGSIPDSLGRLRSPTAGLSIHLENNQLTGPVPQSFRNLKISHIDLSRNRLTGDPSLLFRTADLVTTQFLVIFDLGRNRFKFDLSNAEISPRTDKLDLSHNQIYGKIPEQLAKHKPMEFNVSYNHLCGRIPRGWLQDLTIYEFSHNQCLCGKPLPPCK